MSGFRTKLKIEVVSLRMDMTFSATKCNLAPDIKDSCSALIVQAKYPHNYLKINSIVLPRHNSQVEVWRYATAASIG